MQEHMRRHPTNKREWAESKDYDAPISADEIIKKFVGIYRKGLLPLEDSVIVKD